MGKPLFGFEFFLAKTIIRGKENNFSKPIIRISIIAISLGIAMMTLSMAIVDGFQEEIQKKVVGFGSHIQITKFDGQGQIENKPLSVNREFFKNIQSIDGIKHVQVYANKPAILKTDKNNLGVILKGIGSDFDWNFFSEYIKEGKALDIVDESKSNGILISSSMASSLELQLNDELLVYFVQDPPRLRKLKITGIYHTGLGEMDDQIAMIDIKHIQKLNKWESSQVGGVEVLLEDFNRLDELDQTIYEEIDYDLSSTSIKEARIDIFNWLELQDVNVVVIISLLILVCGIDVISALLILILERTQMIGVLKSLGAKNKSIRSLFMYQATYIIIIGLFLGNVLGLGLALLQEQFGWLSLPQEAYFIDQVPIKLNIGKLLMLNLGTLICCLIMLIIPSNLIAKIEPSKSIRFD